MENLTDLPHGVSINPPSLWFWVKAGFGFAIGNILIFTVAWLVFVVMGLGIIGTLAGLGHHR